MTPYQKHFAKWKDCELCPLHSQRHRIVLARGKVPADVVLIGEGPGESEDALGSPFVGPAGRQLNHIVERAFPGHMELAEDGWTEHWICDVRCAFTNLVACFPRNAKKTASHEPEPAEVKACSPRLVEFVRMCKPKLIVRVGKLASKYVYGQAQFSIRKDHSLEWLPRNQFLHFVDMVHPAAILRAPLANRGLMVQKAVVVLSEALEEALK